MVLHDDDVAELKIVSKQTAEVVDLPHTTLLGVGPNIDLPFTAR